MGFFTKYGVDPISRAVGIEPKSVGKTVDKGLGMGFLFGSSNNASPPPVPPPPAPVPQAQDPQIAKAGQDARKRARMAAGFGSNVQTGPQGLTEPAVTTGKSLLGS